MGLLLAFAPFLAFLAAGRFLGIAPALCIGCAVAVALIVRGRLRGARETRVLEAGTALLFGALAIGAAVATDVAWSVALVRLTVDCGLLLLVLAGVALGRPFTLDFARDKVTPERAATPAYLTLHRQISAAWAGAFGMLALADLVLILQPAWPVAIPLAIGAAGLFSALKFSQWWPARGRPRGA